MPPPWFSTLAVSSSPGSQYQLPFVSSCHPYFLNQVLEFGFAPKISSVPGGNQDLPYSQLDDRPAVTRQRVTQAQPRRDNVPVGDVGNCRESRFVPFPIARLAPRMPLRRKEHAVAIESHTDVEREPAAELPGVAG